MYFTACNLTAIPCTKVKIRSFSFLLELFTRKTTSASRQPAYIYIYLHTEAAILCIVCARIDPLLGLAFAEQPRYFTHPAIAADPPPPSFRKDAHSPFCHFHSVYTAQEKNRKEEVSFTQRCVYTLHRASSETHHRPLPFIPALI